MDVLKESLAPLQQLWEDERIRQQSKLVILEAVGNVTQLTVNEAQLVMSELDRLLLAEEEQAIKQKNPGL